MRLMLSSNHKELDYFAVEHRGFVPTTRGARPSVNALPLSLVQVCLLYRRTFFLICRLSHHQCC